VPRAYRTGAPVCLRARQNLIIKESEMQQEIGNAIARMIMLLVIIALIEAIGAGFTITLLFSMF